MVCCKPEGIDTQSPIKMEGKVEDLMDIISEVEQAIADVERQVAVAQQTVDAVRRGVEAGEAFTFDMVGPVGMKYVRKAWTRRGGEKDGFTKAAVSEGG